MLHYYQGLHGLVESLPHGILNLLIALARFIAYIVKTLWVRLGKRKKKRKNTERAKIEKICV
jgi:hypothetical protein